MLQAQIPNSGFESWTSMGTYDLPNLWGNMNPSTSGSGVFTTVKGAPGASGSYFLKLTTKDAGGVITPGMVVSGQLNTATWKPKSGFPYTERVQNLKGKYQFMGYNNDAAQISAWLTKWNVTLQKRDTIASLSKIASGMVHVWTNFSIPFVYQKEDYPDTAVIMISSSGTSPQKNSFIWIDDLVLDGFFTSVQKAEPLDDAQVFPSPARNEINLVFKSKKSFSSQLQILNSTGLLVYQRNVIIYTGSNLLTTDLANFYPSAGLFFIRLQTPDGLLTRKFIIGH